MSNENGAFSMYQKYLNIILDIVINYEYQKMSPRLFISNNSQALNLLISILNLKVNFVLNSEIAESTSHLVFHFF